MTAAQIKKLRRKIRRRRTIRRWRFLLILLGLLLAGFVGHWAYGKLLNRQAYALASRAIESWREGKLQEARMGVETALRIRPGHPQAQRLLARIQAASGEPEEALATFQQLADERQLGLEDLKIYANLASQKGESQLADRLAKSVAANGDPAFPHLLSANTLLRENKIFEAEAEIRAAVAAAPNDTTRSALLGFLLKTRKPGESLQEAAGIIQDFSTRDSALGVQALALGLQTGLMDPQKRGEWIEKLRFHPKTDARHRLFADTAALAMKPDLQPQVATEPVEFIKPRPLSDRAMAARWLTNKKEASKALSILDFNEAITRQESFLVWLDASAAVGNWSESLAALDHPKNPLPAPVSQLFKGIAFKKLGRTEESQAAFRQGIREAGDDPAKFATVTTYLLGAEESTLFEANLQKASNQLALAPAVFNECYPVVLAQRDAAFTLRFLEALGISSIVARSPRFQNDIAHERILLDKSPKLDFLRKYSAKNPNNLALVATLALAELKAGQAKNAKALFDSYGPDIDIRLLPPRVLCIFTAMLAANGKTDLARKVANLIPPTALSKQEVDFLNSRP
jgi:tetratricopeptide (TPR) repeat protein